MRRAKRLPLHMADDSPEMTAAIEQISSHNVMLRRTSAHQLKCGDLNFWPDTGKITQDGVRKVTASGLDAFIEMMMAQQKRTQRTLIISLGE